MASRQFPLHPRSTRDLEIGDYWTVRLIDGSLGACVVTDLKRSGPGSLKTLAIGVLNWRSYQESKDSAITRRDVLAQGLTRIEIFTEGGAVVLGNIGKPTAVSDLASPYRDFAVGTRTQTWGWKVIANRVQAVLDGQQM